MEDKKLKSLKPEYKKVGLYDVDFNEKDVRKISQKNFNKLKEKIKQNVYEPIKVWKHNMKVLSGNRRLAVMRHLVESEGYEINQIDIALYDVDEKTARFISLAENTHEGEYDLDKLIDEMGDIESVGLNLSDILDDKTMSKLEQKLKDDISQGEVEIEDVDEDEIRAQTNLTDIIVTDVPKAEIEMFYDALGKIKQITKLRKDWANLRIIVKRINTANDNELQSFLNML